MTPLILLSNDDGVYAKGLRELIDMLRPLGNLFVVAPDKARSGSACSLSSEIPVTADLLETSEGLTVYACSGTPVDCVKLALDQLLASRPDLIVGGINHGNNATINVHYSGTLGVALEGALQGIPSVAFSLCDRDPDADFEPLRPYVQRITSQALRQTLPYGSCLNVNFPPDGNYRGLRVARMAYSRWQDEFQPCIHPGGSRYFWLAGECVNDEPDETDTDSWALDHQYVAVTPIKIDVTDYNLKEALADWDL